MSSVLHISDTHFGTERREAIEALVELAQACRPTLVVLSGDVTQRARDAQFRIARDFVDRLQRPLLAIPGNHDIPLFNLLARWRTPFTGYRRWFGDELEPIWHNEDLLAIGVNTVRPRRHKDGQIDPAQIDRVAGCLRRATPRQLRIVVTHQPVHVIEASDEGNRLIGADAAIAHWAAAGVDLILGGHIHLPYVRPLREHHPILARDVWVVQAGTAVSRRIRGNTRNSVYLIHSEGGHRCGVEQWDHPGGKASFRQVASTSILLDRSGVQRASSAMPA